MTTTPEQLANFEQLGVEFSFRRFDRSAGGPLAFELIASWPTHPDPRVAERLARCREAFESKPSTRRGIARAIVRRLMGAEA